MSNIQQHAMSWNMEDGLRVEPKERERNIDALLEEIRPDPRPNFQPGLRLPVSNDIERTILCAGPYFALERWRVIRRGTIGSTTRQSSATSACRSPHAPAPGRMHSDEQKRCSSRLRSARSPSPDQPTC